MTRRIDLLSYLRDPLTFAFGLMVAFSVAVVMLMVQQLLATPEAIAEDVAMLQRGGPPVASELVAVEIPEGTGAAEIREILLEAGALADAGAYDTLLVFSGVNAELKAGQYEFETGTPASEVIRQLRSGGIDADLVRIPEGLRVEEVGAILVAERVVTAGEWEAAVTRAWQHPALLGKPAETSLLGYLLPASFPFRETTTADDAVQAMLDAFVEQVTTELRQEAAIAGLSMHEVLTLASIVEREAALAEEQPLVASVFLNRLEQGIALQADPTVQFVISTPESVEEFGWVEARPGAGRPGDRLALQQLPLPRVAAGADREPGDRGDRGGGAAGGDRVRVLRGSARVRRIARVRGDARRAQRERRGVPRVGMRRVASGR